jgi:hypothetical protein
VEGPTYKGTRKSARRKAAKDKQKKGSGKKSKTAMEVEGMKPI